MDSQADAILYADDSVRRPVSMTDTAISEKEIDVANRSLQEEGARPSSLIPVHKLSVQDKPYDVQIMRDLAIANELAREYRGADVADTERIKRVNGEASECSGKSIGEGAMKQGKGAFLVLTTFAPMGCFANSTEASFDRTAQVAPYARLSAVAATGRATIAKPRLGASYRRGMSFVEFRKQLLADGWVAVPNPECHEVVLGAIYDDMCLKASHLISCRICDLVPETFRSTSDGYSVMRYTKDGVTLSVTAYGDHEDLDEPGRYGFDVTDWRYDKSIGVKLLEGGY